ncbi:amino acid permease [Coxiella burnetii]|nr:amino acid permease [Coxiella burnetii]
MAIFSSSDNVFQRHTSSNVRPQPMHTASPKAVALQMPMQGESVRLRLPAMFMGEILMYREDFHQTKTNVAHMKRSGIRDFFTSHFASCGSHDKVISFFQVDKEVIKLSLVHWKADMKLKRIFSPLIILLISINGMIGSAWLFGPYFAAKTAGPAALVSWLVGGGLVLIVAFTFAELSTMFPVAGGIARIPQYSHGMATGFMMSWIAWLSCVAMPPIEVLATLQYTSFFFPRLTCLHGNQHVLTHEGLVGAALLMFFLSWLNIASVKHLVRSNVLMTVFKIGIILVIAITLIAVGFHGKNFFAYGGFAPSGWHGIVSAVSMGGIAFAFTGFRHGVELAAETKNPKQAIPLAIIGSIVFCLLLYWLLQLAFIGALHSPSLSKGWAQLAYQGDIGPFSGIAALLGLGWLSWMIYANAVISPLGGALVYVTSTSRIVYGMSKNAYFPAFFMRLNKKAIPVWCIALNGLTGFVLFFVLSGWQSMINFLVSAVVISYGTGPISLITLRYQMPNANRPFKLPQGILLSTLAFYVCNLMVFWCGWESIKKLFAAILIGILFFIVFQKTKQQRLREIHLKYSLWLIIYLGGLTLISYLGSMGGGMGIIPFGWDFIVIALFSLVSLYLAVKSRLPQISAQTHQANTLDSVDSEASA